MNIMEKEKIGEQSLSPGVVAVVADGSSRKAVDQLGGLDDPIESSCLLAQSSPSSAGG